mgnify:CR=1 FL=1
MSVLLNNPQFVTIVLGATGGPREENLSAYLLAPVGSSDFIALDAGTLLTGIGRAEARGSFDDIPIAQDTQLSRAGWILQHCIRAYLLSHAHLDHVAGLVLNSQDDTNKEILGLSSTIETLRDCLFNGRVWANFSHEGQGRQIKQYQYRRLQPGQVYSISGTGLGVEAFSLSHTPHAPSTAFLVQANGLYALYFGDTQADAVGKTEELKVVWTRVAPLVREKKLRGVFLEVSFPEGRSDDMLFGHLTPSWMLKELRHLAQLADPAQPEQALQGLTVVVTHIKLSLERGTMPQEQIAQQLQALNDLGVRFIIPEQGQRIEF